ncbi:MAG: hypothetical protein LBM23_08995 [Propionibacteriaceae bacterium]|jgi:hypothetical protein|nr:hypothetical protein [Propionibacteriaceae bacterium]
MSRSLKTPIAGFAVALVTLLASLLGFVAAPAAQAAPTDEEVAACLDAGNVWLEVVDGETSVASQCVGQPATGTAALEAAGVVIGRDSTGFICSLGGHPDPCPATFDGNYWQYYTATPGAAWAYATEGSDTAVPQPGSIEGWCYGDVCTPPAVGGVLAAPDAVASIPAADAADPDAAASDAPASDSTAASDGSTGDAPIDVQTPVVISGDLLIATPNPEGSPVPETPAEGSSDGISPWIFALIIGVVVIVVIAVLLIQLRRTPSAAQGADSTALDDSSADNTSPGSDTGR